MKGIISSTSFFAVIIVLLLAISPQASGQDSSLDVEKALAVYRSAVRQSEAAANALKSDRVNSSAADKAYEETFTSALWEGIKLVKPEASIDERARLAGLIGSAKALADASSGVALADYILAGMEIDEIVEVRIEQDADEAFRLGYAQAVKRERLLPAKK